MVVSIASFRRNAGANPQSSAKSTDTSRDAGAGQPAGSWNARTWLDALTSPLGLRRVAEPIPVHGDARRDDRRPARARRRERVCVIGLRGIPDVPGGIETHCENIYERLAAKRSDYKFVVYGRSPYIGNARYRTASGVEVVPVPSTTSKYLETIIGTFLALMSARFRERSRIVHIHAIGPGLFAPLARLMGMSVLLTHHGDDYKRAKWNGFARGVLRMGERLGMSTANEVVAVSRALRDRLVADYPTQKETINYIPNGADHILEDDDTTDPKDTLARFGLIKREYIVSVGRLVPEKGFMDLILAHRKSGSNLPLVIVGGNGNSSHDAELFEAAHDSVVFTGALGRSDVKALVGNAALFALPSHHEGLPIVALEASLLETPVLLSDIDANKAIELDEARYFPVGDIDTLAERLKTDCAGVEPSPLSREFLWDNIADKTWSVYRRILA